MQNTVTSLTGDSFTDKQTSVTLEYIMEKYTVLIGYLFYTADPDGYVVPRKKVSLKNLSTEETDA